MLEPAARAARIRTREIGEPRGSALADDADACASVVRRVQRGDPDAFHLLYDAYRTRVYTYLRSVLRNRDDAQEVTQQVFMRAFEKAGTFRLGPEPFGAWLFSIARHAAIDHLRKSAHTAVEAPAAIDRRRDGASEEAMVMDTDMASRLERLPVNQRSVMVMRYLLDLSTTDTGLLLGCSADSVRHVHQRALKALRSQLAPAIFAALLIAQDAFGDATWSLIPG